MRRTPLSFAVALMQNLEWTKVAKDVWCPWQLCDCVLFFVIYVSFFKTATRPLSMQFYPNEKGLRHILKAGFEEKNKMKCGREKKVQE